MKTLKYVLAALVLHCTSTSLEAQSIALSIYPEPQEVVMSNQLYTPPSGYRLKGMDNPDVDAIRLIHEVLPIVNKGKSLPLEIRALKEKTPQMLRSGAYRLTITKRGITIEIADSRSLFYAAQTLKQMAGRNEEGKRTLPLCTVTDYPDVTYRGTVEGFYGTPWSQADRIEQLRFYGKVKMNTYIYGPKDDPYHSSPSWREPYPAKQAAQISELTAEAARNKVDFVWAVHPGKDIQWTLEDSSAILVKFKKMYDLGVRSFAVFFDDISGEGTRAEKQVGLMNYIQKEFIAQKEDLLPLIMCPTEYERDLAKGDYLDILGTQLDPAIRVMWTGDRVVDDITREGVEWVNARIHRPAFIWWNFPVNDYCRDHLLMGPAYGLDTEIAESISGFVSNPMEHAEASKVGIFSVAMYGWNMQSYDPAKAWETACQTIMPEAPLAFRTFAEHNTDPGPNGHLYRRDESVRIKPQVDAFLAGYKTGQFRETDANQIGTLFMQINMAPAMIYSQSTNKQMIQQINPWLIQFELLGKTGTSALQMAHACYQKDHANTWQCYQEVTALMDSMKQINHFFNQSSLQRGIKTGSRVLYPFITEVYRLTGKSLLSTSESSSEEVKVNIRSTLTNVNQMKHQPLMEDESTLAYVPVFEVVKLEPNQYIGLGWEMQRDAKSFSYNLPQSNKQGRTFEWSADGKQWNPLIGIATESVNGILNQIDPKARFIRLINKSNEAFELYVTNFNVTTQEAPEINEALTLYDQNLTTAKVLKEGEKIMIPCKDVEDISLYLSGGNESIVSITGLSKADEKRILYHGYAGYIHLSKELIDDIENLQISTIGSFPVKIHEIVKE
ncbi:MAG: beta-N-acetylglucosaminidase domain-containing protein [Tannerellaceae bacterium]